MQAYIGYIRVSTPKQGTKGVSLIEQRDAIARYAERNQFTIGLWLEEMETAAKRGRPVFNQAMKLLRERKHIGIILHKLDRGARNLKDWAEIGELSDQGVEVHFVNESLDLHSRGGRLSADIQAIVAADYIRNLREETRKGFYGRLKQGFYPLRAPIGYVDTGKANPKTIDPIMGPLSRKAFEMYATGHYSLETLGDIVFQLGLRNRNGGRVTRNGLSTLLNNPFYFGLIRIKKTNETFLGNHETLVNKVLFDRVQKVLSGKFNARTQRHAFPFRRLLACASCHYSLIGERQKGQVYYRCHSPQCSGITIREDAASKEVSEFFRHFRFNEIEKEYFGNRITKLRGDWKSQKEEEVRNLNVRLGHTKDRLNRLMDAFLDQSLDKAMFEERKRTLFLEQKSIEEDLERSNQDAKPDQLKKFLELAGNAGLSHEMGFAEEKREMLKIVTSNRKVYGKKLELEPSLAFRDIANRNKNACCDQHQDIPRMWDPIIDKLAQLNIAGLLPDLSGLFGKNDSSMNQPT